MTQKFTDTFITDCDNNKNVSTPMTKIFVIGLFAGPRICSKWMQKNDFSRLKIMGKGKENNSLTFTKNRILYNHKIENLSELAKH